MTSRLDAERPILEDRVPRMRRRVFASCAAVALVIGTTPASTFAQNPFPTKPIRIIVPFGAGSSPDITARLLGERLAKGLGQPVIIENKAGASTIIGAQTVAMAPADGYTLLYAVNNTISINPYVYKTLPYKAEEFVPVVRVLSVPYVLVTSAQSPYKTLSELMKAAKAQPGKMSYASFGVGQGSHVAMARLLNAAGATMIHVPYSGPALPDVINGLVDVVLEPSTTAIPNIKAGRIRALAVSGPQRVVSLPDVPAVNETFAGFVGDSWHGVVAPKGTPRDVVEKLNVLSQQIIAGEDFQKRLIDLGLVPAGGSPADFQNFLAEDARAWSKVVKDNGIKAE